MLGTVCAERATAVPAVVSVPRATGASRSASVVPVTHRAVSTLTCVVTTVYARYVFSICCHSDGNLCVIVCMCGWTDEYELVLCRQCNNSYEYNRLSLKTHLSKLAYQCVIRSLS